MTTCQFGAYGACDAEATTKRQRPNGEGLWDVCDRHAAFLDRLRANVEKHATLLAKLRMAEQAERFHASPPEGRTSKDEFLARYEDQP